MNTKKITKTITVTSLITFNCFAQWSTNPAVNNAICTANNDQSSSQLVSDGSGGAIITWKDGRN